jgi:hypothetical protein
MKHQGYFTRALRAKDRRYARIFGKLGYDTTALVADDSAPDQRALDISELRETYLKVVGKRPFNGWDAETLLAKIAEHREA